MFLIISLFSEIYRRIEDRDNLWNKMIMMQEQANDPNRFWQNRGGQLLKEEKERKVIQKVKLLIVLIYFDKYLYKSKLIYRNYPK